MTDSKELWKSIDAQITCPPVELGRYTSEDYTRNPKQVGIVAARYKFCAKLLADRETVIEVGCGDGFGSAVVASAVKTLVCTDVNEAMLADSRRRNAFIGNARYEYFDFRRTPYAPPADGAYLVDVIEHIYPVEEPAFMTNLVGSLADHGVLIIGTPNQTAEPYASEWSRRAHVNLKTHESLRELGRRHFHNVFMFGMNDEVVHTGFPQMCHFLWALCVAPKR